MYNKPGFDRILIKFKQFFEVISFGLQADSSPQSGTFHFFRSSHHKKSSLIFDSKKEMNFKLFIILFLSLLLFSCKSSQVKSKELNLISYCSDAFKKGLVEKDPLILVDAKPIGLLSEIDFDNFEFTAVNSNSLNIIPKGSEYLKKFWGENAENGIIEISKLITLHCGTPPKSIFLLDDKEVDWEKLKNLKFDDIKYWTRIDDVVDSEKNNYVIHIVNTK